MTYEVSCVGCNGPLLRNIERPGHGGFRCFECRKKHSKLKAMSRLQEARILRVESGTVDNNVDPFEKWRPKKYNSKAI